MTANLTAVATPTAFTTAIWGGLHSLCSDRGGAFHTVGVYDAVDDLLDAAIAENAAGGNIWFGVHPLARRPEAGRGGRGDVDAVRVLAADLDWHDENAHADEGLPTEAEVRERLGRLEHQPSITVNSGHGLQCYWLLSSAVSADEGHALTLRLHAGIEKLGAPADRADLASVLRVPGCVSRKPGCDPVMVEIEQLNLERRYTPQYLAKRLPPAAKRRAPADTAIVGSERRWWAVGTIGAGRRHGSLVAAAGWCREMGLTRDEAVPYIRDTWQHHDPRRHTLDEALTVLDDVYTRYPAGDRLAELRRDNDPEATAARGTKRRHVRPTPASAIQPRRVRWLWHERVALGSLSLLAGREGIGKSLLAYWVAARITRGELPGEYLGHPRSVLVCATEDSWAHTIVPRLMAHGADLERVYRIDVVVDGALHAELSLPGDLGDVERLANELDVALLVLDPLMSRLDASLDTHRDGEVRQALEPLVATCDTAGMSVLGLIHHNKSGSTDPLQVIMASKAFPAVARSVNTVLVDPEDESGARRLFGTPKNNLGRSDLPVLSFTVNGWQYDTDDGPGWTGQVAWGDNAAGTIQDVMSRAARDPDKRTAETDAVAWLREHMAENAREVLDLDGGRAVEAADVREAATANGYSYGTLLRAKKVLGIVAEKGRGAFKGRWFWLLPHEGTSLARGDTQLVSSSSLVPSAPGQHEGTEGTNNPAPDTVGLFGTLDCPACAQFGEWKGSCPHGDPVEGPR